MTRLLKILHVITGLGAGGAERQLATLVLSADPGRVRHEVVSLTDGGIWNERLRERGAIVHTLGMTNRLGDLMAIPRLARLIHSTAPDLVQTWLYHADFLGLLGTKLAGTPAPIWTLRCSDMRLEHYSRRTRLLLRLLAFLSRSPIAVVANAKSGWAWHESLGYRPPRHLVIPNGIDTEAFQPRASTRASVRVELGLPTNTQLIGNFSRHDPMKDHPTFFKAIAGSNPDAWILLAGIGTGPDNDLLTRQIAEAGLAPGQVWRLGERNDVPRLLAALDLVVLSSAFGEGFPNVVAEAMACGVAVVGTDVGDTAQVIGDAGRVVPPGDPAALTRAMTELLTLDAMTHAGLRQRARERIETGFSVPAMVAAYEALYRELVAARGK